MNRSLYIVAICIILLLAGCTKKESEPLKLGFFTGPTGISVAQILEESPTYKGPMHVEPRIFSAPPEVVPFLVKGELDIVTLPLNVGIKLIQAKGVEYKLAAVTGTGMLQVISRDSSLTTLKDLENTTVYGMGKGGTPELVYNILTQEGEVYAPLDFTYNAPVQLLAALREGLIDTALLPEPFVTTALVEPLLHRVIDIDEVWKELIGNPDTYPMTGVYVRSDLVDKHPQVVKALLEDIEKSIQWVQENPRSAGNVLEKFGIMKSTLVERSIQNLELTYIDGSEMRKMVSAYVEVVLPYDAASVGGKTPGAELFLP